MDTETKMLIDCLSLFPDYLDALRSLSTVDEVENWIDAHEKSLVRFGRNDVWERTKFYSSVNYEQVYQWVKGEIYV